MNPYCFGFKTAGGISDYIAAAIGAKGTEGAAAAGEAIFPSFRSGASYIFLEATEVIWAEDTAENRSLIESAVRDGDVERSWKNGQGGNMKKYTLELPNGDQSWAEVLNGKTITNGGLNKRSR